MDPSRRQARSWTRERDLPGDRWREWQAPDFAEIIGNQVFVDRIRVDPYRVCRTLTMQAAPGSKMKRSYARSGANSPATGIPSALRMFLLRRLLRPAFFPGSFFNVGGDGLKSLRFDNGADAPYPHKRRVPPLCPPFIVLRRIFKKKCHEMTMVVLPQLM